ncbi:hypothetical protein AGLY_018300 [Aphis glycines]|uniref:Uncharacterized protein n=1 Tax=Aphis glycines TaxID=307491 RepID=A0A6G0SU96_APHGL|nr:hypothetical protein AGLY_018300 [Aphis glycines]
MYSGYVGNDLLRTKETNEEMSLLKNKHKTPLGLTMVNHLLKCKEKINFVTKELQLSVANMYKQEKLLSTETLVEGITSGITSFNPSLSKILIRQFKPLSGNVVEYSLNFVTSPNCKNFNLSVSLNLNFVLLLWYVLLIQLRQYSMSKDLVCKVLNKWLVIKKISLKMCAIKANSKDFKFFECPIAPQIDSADDFGSMLIVSKTVIKDIRFILIIENEQFCDYVTVISREVDPYH